MSYILWPHLFGNKVKLNQQIVGSSGTEILNLFDEKRTVSRSKRSEFIFLVNSGAHQGENTYKLQCMQCSGDVFGAFFGNSRITREWFLGFSSIWEETRKTKEFSVVNVSTALHRLAKTQFSATRE